MYGGWWGGHIYGSAWVHHVHALSDISGVSGISVCRVYIGASDISGVSGLSGHGSIRGIRVGAFLSDAGKIEFNDQIDEGDRYKVAHIQRISSAGFVC